MAYTTIDDPSEYFHTQLYTGNGNTNRDITNDANAGDFQPDFLWLKNRTDSSQHHWFNSSVGMPNHLNSDLSDAEQTATNKATAFNTNGFRVQDHSQVNGSSKNYVAWQWKANGGTTTTNDASSTGVGNNDSVIQANTTAGFSIVTFTSPGSGLTIAHGLGGKPDLIISKSRESTENWGVHTTLIDGSLDFLRISETDAAGNSGFSLPTSTVFGYNGSTNVDYVAYCFRSIQGYSKLGIYSGNGNNNGTFVYLGFKPTWLLVKRTNSAESWQLVDNKRSPFNVMDEVIRPNSSGAENSNQGGGDSIDFLSNGFKPRSSAGQFNNGSSTYLYMAFAEHPFVSSKGVPTTAR